MRSCDIVRFMLLVCVLLECLRFYRSCQHRTPIVHRTFKGVIGTTKSCEYFAAKLLSAVVIVKNNLFL